MRRRGGSFALLLSVLALVGCTGHPQRFLPADSPDGPAVRLGASLNPAADQRSALPYLLLPLSPAILARLRSEDAAPAFPPEMSRIAPAPNVIGIGDVISMTIFEARAGGLFVPEEPGARPGNFVQIPAQEVDRTGTITIPFGGSMRVLGLSPAELERRIVERLGNRALEPQVVVSRQRIAGVVSVLGEVNNTTRFTIDPSGERLLGAIARAGGPRPPLWETMVTLHRGGAISRALLSDVARRPEQNVPLSPGDVLVVEREPRFFLVIGAVGQAFYTNSVTRRFSFDGPRITMADGISRAGGLHEDRADPRAVFLLRQEPAARMRALGLPVPDEAAETVPTVYWVDLLEPGAIFLANSFPMRAQDVLLVSSAPFTDVSRALGLLLPFAQSGAAGRATVAP